jgi:hypothetical protein
MTMNICINRTLNILHKYLRISIIMVDPEQEPNPDPYPYRYRFHSNVQLNYTIITRQFPYTVRNIKTYDIYDADE